LEAITEWISNNYTWVFSGVGILVLGGIIALFKRKRSGGTTQKQRSGNNSTNVQAGGNVEFTQKNNK
jgi:LPXTG-motif cell wall-anchored protein